MNNKLIVAWRNTLTRIWTPVAILELIDNEYHFSYTNGAKVENFVPFGLMQNKTKTYVSKELFPILKNRLLAKSRPEYNDYLDWLDIDKENNNDFLELAKTRGIRVTDEIQLFQTPEINKNNEYEITFFAHGLSHMLEEYVERLARLKENDRLVILKDIQNEFDSNALLIATSDDPIELLGYFPAFLCKDINRLLIINGNSSVQLTVYKINKTAPKQLKLLCKLKTKWPENFKPFDSDDFKKYN